MNLSTPIIITGICINQKMYDLHIHKSDSSNKPLATAIEEIVKTLATDFFSKIGVDAAVLYEDSKPNEFQFARNREQKVCRDRKLVSKMQEMHKHLHGKVTVLSTGGKTSAAALAAISTAASTKAAAVASSIGVASGGRTEEADVASSIWSLSDKSSNTTKSPSFSLPSVQSVLASVNQNVSMPFASTKASSSLPISPTPISPFGVAGGSATNALPETCEQKSNTTESRSFNSASLHAPVSEEPAVTKSPVYKDFIKEMDEEPFSYKDHTFTYSQLINASNKKGYNAFLELVQNPNSMGGISPQLKDWLSHLALLQYKRHRTYSSAQDDQKEVDFDMWCKKEAANDVVAHIPIRGQSTTDLIQNIQKSLTNSAPPITYFEELD
jgi:hypothetical protein